MNRIIAACGNDCAACPRYTAHPCEKTDEELRAAAILVPSMIGYIGDSKLATANSNAKLVHENIATFCTKMNPRSSNRGAGICYICSFCFCGGLRGGAGDVEDL